MGTITELQIVCKLITFPELDLGHFLRAYFRNIFMDYQNFSTKTKDNNLTTSINTTRLDFFGNIHSETSHFFGGETSRSKPSRLVELHSFILPWEAQAHS